MKIVVKNRSGAKVLSDGLLVRDTVRDQAILHIQVYICVSVYI